MEVFFAFIFILVLAIVLGCVLGTMNSSNQSGISIQDQPSSSLQIVSSSKNTMRISIQLDPNHKSALWKRLDGNGSLGPPVFNDSTQNPPNYQIITLNSNEFIVLEMPSFTAPWRITPLSKGVPTTEMPILIECNKDIVCDMSAVDGVNYLLKMELTADPSGPTTIDFNTSPCDGKTGCKNPFVNGDFKVGTDPSSAPCPFGTCNLIGLSREWASKINTGQCSNVDSTWPTNGYASGCHPTQAHPRMYTTYTYSHSDQNSSPTLVAPFKVRATYRDL